MSACARLPTDMAVGLSRGSGGFVVWWTRGGWARVAGRHGRRSSRRPW
jgi:membrane-bound inhibitor of C-type lysozyme